MSYEVNKITNEMLDGKGVVGLPNTPQLSASEMQRKFDEVAVEVIVPAFNTLCDALDVGGGEENERFIAVETDIANIYDVEIPALVQNIEDAKEETKKEANDYTDEKIGELPVVPEWALAEEKPTYTAEEVGALPDTTLIPTKTSELDNDSNFLTEHQDISGKQDKLVAGDNITIEGNVISAEGGGTSVSVEPIVTVGTNIADITINGITTQLYAPTGGGGGGVSSYGELPDKPQINGVTLNGNKSLEDLGINIPTKTSDLDNDSEYITNIEVEAKGYATESWVEDKGYLTEHQDISGKADKTQLSNRNLLDNGWFTVNQRGLTSGSGYVVDRWKSSNDTSIMTVFENGVKFGNNGYFTQIIDEKLYDSIGNNDVTISIKFADGTIRSQSGKFNSSKSLVFAPIADSNLALYHNITDGNKLNVRGGESEVIRAIKLEIGSVSTLANDVAPNYADELLKCQRYFVRFKANTSNHAFVLAHVNDGTTLRFPITLPTFMRSNAPTVSFGGLIKATSGSSGNAVNCSGLSRVDMCANVLILQTSGTFTVNGNYMMILNDANTYIDISAEL